MRQKAIACVMVAMLVATAFATVPVGAATQDYEHQFTGSPSQAVVDLGNVTGTVVVEVSTNDNVGGQERLYLRRMQVDATNQEKLAFDNQEAYSNVTLHVRNADAEPTFSTGDDLGVTSTAKHLGTTAGDRDNTCDLGEKIANAANPWIHVVDCNSLPGTTDVNQDVVTEDKKLEIYTSAQTQNTSADNFLTVVENRLQDAETTAKMKGYNAYIRSLNRGDGESAAKSEAINNITEFYSAQERNLLAEWEAQVSNIKYLRSVADNDSNIGSGYVDVPYEDRQDGRIDTSMNNHAVDTYISGYTTKTYTLQNGTSVNVTAINVVVENNAGDTNTYTIGPTDGPKMNAAARSGNEGLAGSDVSIERVWVDAPNSNYDPTYPLYFQRYADALSEIDSQTSSAINGMETVVNQTYSEYQAGEINNSDLVDPWVLNSEFSPGTEYEGWAAAQLTSLGVNTPEDYDQTGYMNITTEDGSTYKGMLFSQENPAGGQFEAGATYNAAEVNGSQYVVTEDRTIELTGNFTVDDIQNADGEKVQNITIVEKSYNTTSVEEMKQLYDNVSKLRAELSAKMDSQSSAGAGVFGGDSNLLVLVVIAGLAVAAFKRDNGGGRRGRR